MIEIDRPREDFKRTKFAGAASSVIVAIHAVTIMTGRSGNLCLILASNSRPSMPGMLMSKRTAISAGWISPASQIQRLWARGGEMHHVSSLAGFSAKALAKQVGDIGLVVHDQDARATRSFPERQAHAHDAASAIGVC